MSITGLAGAGGIGFVLLAITANLIYIRGGLPVPGSGKDVAEVTASFASLGGALKKPSVLMPAAWLCTTVFGAGLLSALWHGGTAPGAWALAGFAGVLMQNAAFAVVEALRFALAAAARDGRSLAGLWSLSNVLFGFNQVFLTLALTGFSAAGAGTGLFPAWQAWLGYASGALLFISASASPYNTDGNNRISLAGLIGWLGWVAWILACSITLIRL